MGGGNQGGKGADATARAGAEESAKAGADTAASGGADPSHEVRKYRILSFEVLQYANQGLSGREFFEKVLTRLLEFSGCDRLETWVAEDGKHYRSAAASGGEAFSFRLMPFRLDAAGGGETPDLDRLCRAVIRRQHGSGHPCFTSGGSFWTGDVSKLRTLSIGDERDERLDFKNGCRSLAVIPVEAHGQCIGVLIMQSRARDFFDKAQIELYEDLAKILAIALDHSRAQIELRERVKELTCLYGIAREVARGEASFETILANIVQLLPPGWLYPEAASARIVIDGQVYMTRGFSESSFSQKADIVAGGQRVGFVEVSYSQRMPEMDEGPFLTEERHLIDSIARELALFYKRRKAEDEAAQLHEQLRHADRLATIGQLAAGVAHELNEPLGNILGFAQLAGRTPGLPEQAGRDLAKIVSASLHAKEIIKKLMVFARELPARLIAVDLSRVAEESLYFFEARCVKAGIALVRRLDSALPPITGDPGQLNQVIVNLVVNALQAMPAGGTLVVETLAHEGHVLLIVADTGCGMTEDVKRQIFIPFFTTKDVNEGTGLGLAVVHGIVTSHRGTIAVDSEPGKGARFEIRFPAASSQS